MNNYEIEYTLREYGVKVTCADELPTLVKKSPRWYVVNTDRCGNPGRQWTVFYFPQRGPADFFDSLGNLTEHYHRRFKDVFMANGPRYLYLKNRLQALDSEPCGQYCIYYVQQRSRGRTMEDIFRDFRINRYVQNDAFLGLLLCNQWCCVINIRNSKLVSLFIRGSPFLYGINHVSRLRTIVFPMRVRPTQQKTGEGTNDRFDEWCHNGSFRDE